MTESHEHRWTAVKEWYGRYKCAECSIFGFRKNIVSGFGPTPTIAPYICMKSKCKSAVRRYRKDLNGSVRGFCEDHCKEYDKKHGLKFDSSEP